MSFVNTVTIRKGVDDGKTSWALASPGRRIAILGAAILHVVALFSGPGLIEALGAPPNIVESASKGTLLAPLVILAIAIVLFFVGACALATAGSARQIPFARPVLYLTAAVLVLRAAALPVLLAIVPAVRSQISLFEVATAMLCFVLGGLFWLGLRSTRNVPAMIGG